MFIDVKLVRELTTELSVPVFVFVMKPLSDVGVERTADVAMYERGLDVRRSRKVPDLLARKLLTILVGINGAPEVEV